MKTYQVHELAKISRLSVRTLHYYDGTGLLNPSYRNNNKYRIYEHKDLLRLQQILFYKKLNFNLKKIKQILDNPDFDILETMENHKKMLINEISKNENLINTINKTILHIKKQKMLTDKELYEGFSNEEIKSYNQEAYTRWGKKNVQEVTNKLKTYSKQKWASIKAESDNLYKKMAEIMRKGEKPESKEMQDLIKQHKKHLEYFYKSSNDMYKELGNMYSDDLRFRAFYDKYEKNLSDFITKAINYYCDNIKS